MAIKNTIHERCPNCGERAAHVHSGMVWWGGHYCKNKRPMSGPSSFPRPQRIEDVIFVPDPTLPPCCCSGCQPNMAISRQKKQLSHLCDSDLIKEGINGQTTSGVKIVFETLVDRYRCLRTVFDTACDKLNMIADIIGHMPGDEGDVVDAVRKMKVRNQLQESAGPCTARAIQIIEASRRSHQSWLNHYQEYPEDESEYAALVGDRDHHRRDVENYDHVLSVLRHAAGNRIETEEVKP